MHIHTHVVGPIGTNVYVVCNGDRALLIDPAPGSWEMLGDVLAPYTLDVLLTHGHWDHVADAALFQKHGATVYAHAGDVEWIRNPALVEWFTTRGVTVHPCEPDVLCDSGPLTLAGLNFEVRHTPGHSRGCIVLYSAEHNVLFSGDTLFAGAVGRTDLPSGSTAQLRNSLKTQLATLPPETIVYPGHGKSTIIHDELAFQKIIKL